MIEARRLDPKLITFSCEDFQEKFHDHNNNNNDILLWTHGPYHRHKSTKSVLLYISAHYRNGVST